MPIPQPKAGMGTCMDCGEECDFYMEDMGIGSYEYWGAKGVDVHWVEVSCCCDAEVDNPTYEPDQPDPYENDEPIFENWGP